MTSESILQNAYAIAFCDHILPELVSFGEAPWVILLMTENSNRDRVLAKLRHLFRSRVAPKINVAT